MALGDLLQLDSAPLVVRRRLAPRDAAAKALAAYLMRQQWLIPASNEQINDVRFSLNQCLEEWPNEHDGLNQPSASITTILETTGAHNFTPTALESTLNRYGPGTVLWKVNEISVLFQVDFWLTNKPERQAIHAGITECFAPYEGRYGVLVEGPADYWSQPIRFTLESDRGIQRQDDSDSVLERNRGLYVRIRADIDDLQLRRGVLLDPRVSLSVNDGPAELIVPRPPPEQPQEN